MVPWFRSYRRSRVFLVGALSVSLLAIVLRSVTSDGENTIQKSPSHASLAELRITRVVQRPNNIINTLKEQPITKKEIGEQALSGSGNHNSRLPLPKPGRSKHGSEPEVFRRARHVRHVCQGREKELAGVIRKNDSYFQINIDQERNYAFCPIFKAGTTFLRRAFYSVDFYGFLTNPYNIPINRALRRPRQNLLELSPPERPQAQQFISGANSFLVVREPFVRLLSGYMDKLFAPNPYFWEQIGRYAVSKYRAHTTRRERACGADLTFNEAAQYVVDVELNKDARAHGDIHFLPAYDLCKVCSMNYTMVGKLETLNKDVHSILQELNIHVSADDLEMWRRDATKDAIKDSVESAFSRRSSILMCMSWSTALRRIWRKLQSRAIIPLEEDFPFSEKQAESSITAKQFILAAHNAHLRAGKARLNRQKKEVLAMAFQTLDRQTLSKFLKVFAPDFTLFQYDIQPDFIFNKTFVAEVGVLPNIFDTTSPRQTIHTKVTDSEYLIPIEKTGGVHYKLIANN